MLTAKPYRHIGLIRPTLSGGATGMATVAMATALSGVLWLLMVLAIALLLGTVYTNLFEVKPYQGKIAKRRKIFFSLA